MLIILLVRLTLSEHVIVDLAAVLRSSLGSSKFIQPYN